MSLGSTGAEATPESPDSPDDNNAHVQELRRVFEACSGLLEDGELRLDRGGVTRLCRELRLTAHSDFIAAALLPHPQASVPFPQFKRRFIALLPEVVELSETSGGGLGGGIGAGGETAGIASPASRSDADTSNDVLSDELCLGAQSRSSSTRTLKAPGSDSGPELSLPELTRKLRDLGLSDSGYLGRYELQILCQHLPELRKRLFPELREGPWDQNLFKRIFGTIDTDKDGRISLEDLVSALKAGTDCADMDEAGHETSPQVASEIYRKRWKAQLLRAKEASAQLHASLDGSGGSGGMGGGGRTLAPINFFEQIEGSESGFLRSERITEHWERLGIPEAGEVLNALGFGSQDIISLAALSRRLEAEVSEVALGSPHVTAAVLCYRAHLEYLAAAAGEQRRRAEHHRAEARSVSARLDLLVDEMDAAQAHLTSAHQAHIMSLERSWKEERDTALSRLEEDRTHLQVQVGDLEQALHALHREEAAKRSRNVALERENGRLKREADEVSLSLRELEALNGDLRKEVESQAEAMARLSATTNTPSPASVPHSMTQSHDEAAFLHKLQLLTAENKRLRDQVDELLEAQRRHASHKSRAHKKGLHSGSRWGGAVLKTPNTFSIDGKASSSRFKKEVHRLKRKKEAGAEGLDSPEFESEEEAFHYRPRVKRRLQKRHRKPTLERRNQRRDDEKQVPSSSDELRRGKKGGGAEEALLSALPLSNDPADTTQLLLHRLRAEMAALEETQEAEIARLKAQFEKEKAAIKEQKNAEIRVILETKEAERSEWAREKEFTLRSELEAEKRKLELAFASERNAADRAFAEEKMEMMARLQEDFEAELRKARSANVPAPVQAAAPPAKAKGFLGRLASNNSANVSPAVSLGSIDRSKLEELEKEKKILEDSLAGQRNGYEARISSLKKSTDATIAELNTKIANMKNWSSPDDLPENLRSEYAAFKERLEKSAAEKLEAEREEWGKEKDGLNATAAAKEAEMGKKVEAEKAAVEEARQESSSLQSQLQILEEKLGKAEASRLAAEAAAEAKEAPRTELESRLAAQSEEAARIQADFDRRLRTLSSEHQTKLAEQAEIFATQEKSLRERIALLEEQKASLIADNASELVQLEERYKKNTETEAEKQSRSERVQALTREKDVLLSHLEEANKQKKEAEEARDALLNTTQSSQQHLEVEIEKERREKLQLSSNLEAAQKDRTQLKQELEQVRTQHNQLQAQQAEVADERRELISSLESLSARQVSEEELEALKKARAAAETQLADLRQALEEEQTNHRNTSSTVTQLQSQVKEAEDGKAALVSRLEEAERATAANDASVSAELPKLKHQVAQLTNQRLEAEARQSQAQERLADLEQELSLLRDEKASRSSSESQMVEEAKRELANVKERLESTQSELNQLQEEYEKSQSAMTTEQEQRLEAETALTAAKSRTTELEESLRELTLRVEAGKEEEGAELRRVRADWQALQTRLDTASQASQEKEHQLSAQLAQEQQDREQDRSKMEELSREITSLQSVKTQLEDKVETLQARIGEQEEEVKMCRAEGVELKEKLAAELLRSENEVAKYQHLAQEAHSQLNLLRSSGDSSAKETESRLADLTDALDSAKAKAQGLKTQLEAEQAHRADAEARLADIEARLAQETGARAQVEEELVLVRTQAAAIPDTDSDSAVHSGTQTDVDMASLEEEKSRLERELQKRTSELETELSLRAEKLQALSEEIGMERDNSAHAEEALREELGEANLSIARLQENLGEAQRSVRAVETELEVARSELEKERTELKQRLGALEAGTLNTSESGIEDGGPGSAGEDGRALRLRQELEAAQGVILDLRTALSVVGSQETRKRIAGDGSERLEGGDMGPLLLRVSDSDCKPEWQVLAGENERLREEAFLMESRLTAKDELLAETVAKYKSQLQETASLGRLVQELWHGDGEPEWREVEARLGDMAHGLQ